MGSAPELATWIVSGQSNACGRAPLPGAEGHSHVEVFNPQSARWEPAGEPLPFNGSVGPWLKAAAHLGRAGIRVRLTGFAKGGQPIGFWDDGQPGAVGLFEAIKRDGAGATVFLWYQGEADANPGMSGNAYKAKLADLIARVRRAANNPQMLAVIIQLAACHNSARDFMAVREAQRQFVCEDPHALLVPAMGRMMMDNVHLAKEGYFALGDEIARALFRHYGRMEECCGWPGPVLDAAVLESDGVTVMAHFAEVKQLSGVDAGDFGVFEDMARVPVVQAQAQRTRVALTLERPVKLPARLVYGLGTAPQAALVDEHGNRAPAAQLELSAGPAPDDVETDAPNGAGRV